MQFSKEIYLGKIEETISNSVDDFEIHWFWSSDPTVILKFTFSQKSILSYLSMSIDVGFSHGIQYIKSDKQKSLKVVQWSDRNLDHPPVNLHESEFLHIWLGS